MQLSNGAIKTSAPPPALMNQLATQELEGVDLETFDLSAFVSTGITKDKSTDKAVLSPEVQNFMKESEELFKLGEKFEVEVVERGHQALYELLASIYSLSLRIEESPHKEKIVEAIRTDLKNNHQINIQANSTPIAAMCLRRFNADHLCRLKLDRGLLLDCLLPAVYNYSGLFISFLLSI